MPIRRRWRLIVHTAGQIVQLPIRDNQHVNKGDLLFVVDPRPYRLALDTAKTKLNLTEIEIKTLNDTINSAAAQLTDRKIEARRRCPKQTNAWTASCPCASAIS